jgi:hypothetical protein
MNSRVGFRSCEWGRVASVKAVFLTNKQPGTRANAGTDATASFAETENGWVLRTGNGPEPGRPGQRRPSQRDPNPRQHWGKRAKKNQPRVVGFLNSGGGMRTRVQIHSSNSCGKFKALVPALRRLSLSHCDNRRHETSALLMRSLEEPTDLNDQRAAIAWQHGARARHVPGQP